MNDPRERLAEAAESVGISLADLSKRVGKNHAYLQQFVKRGVPKRLPEDVRGELSVILGVPEDELGAPKSASATIRGSAAIATAGGVIRPQHPSNASPPVPIPPSVGTMPMLGSGVAGVDGKFVLNGNKIMDVLCPPQLVGVPNAYGVFVHGNSMEPRYHPGEAVFVNPHLPVRQTDYVVVQIAEEDESGDTSGYVKRFVSMNSRELVLEQFQPLEDLPADVPEAERFIMRFDRRRVVAVHKIVGSGIA